MRRLHSRWLCVAVTLLHLGTFNPAFQYYACGQEVPAVAGSDSSELEAKQLARTADEMERMFDQLEVAAREIPRDTFDPRAIIQQVGPDPVKLFEWVRDNTYWVPYRGSLRGPVGVLMDRLGNSLDRSLLLAKLLESSGHRVRLARAELSKRQAEAMYSSIRRFGADSVPAQQPISLDKIEELMATHLSSGGLPDPDRLKRSMIEAVTENQRVSEEIAQQVTDQTSMLLSKLDCHGNRTAALDVATDSISDHWWVQWRDEDGWYDLDPMLANTQPDERVIDPETTLRPDVLNKELVHSIEIRVLVEQWENGQLKEHTALKHTIRPSELIGRRISFLHHPLHWPGDEKVFQDKNDPMGSFKKALLRQREWLPILRVGSDVIAQSSFTDAGDLNEDPRLDPTARTGKEIRKRFGGIARALGGELKSRKPRVKNTLLTAELVEYRVQVPGKPVRTHRRYVFDLLGPTQRLKGQSSRPHFDEPVLVKRACELSLGQQEILASVCEVPEEYVAAIQIKNTLAFSDVWTDREAIQKLNGQGRRSRILQQLVKSQANLELLPADLYTFSAARHVHRRGSHRMYFSMPNLVTHRGSVLIDGEQDARVRFALDIIANELDVLPWCEEDPFPLRVEQGVLDTILETLILSPHGKTSSTAQLTELSVSQGTDWMTVNRTDVKGATDAAHGIRDDLDRGYVVIAPQQPPDVSDKSVMSWWRIDPERGDTLGIAATGGGQADVETSELVMFLVVEGGAALAGWICERENYHSGPCNPCYLMLLGGFGFLFSFGAFAVGFSNLELATVVLAMTSIGAYWLFKHIYECAVSFLESDE